MWRQAEVSHSQLISLSIQNHSLWLGGWKPQRTPRDKSTISLMLPFLILHKVCTRKCIIKKAQKFENSL